MQSSPNKGLSRPEVPHDDPAVAAALSVPLLAKCDEAVEVALEVLADRFLQKRQSEHHADAAIAEALSVSATQTPRSFLERARHAYLKKKSLEIATPCEREVGKD